jgi:hypothetical protein
MNYVKYNRSFVMMEEQGNQFAAKESVPIKGYLKVETGNNKGALRCAVQNLRYYEKGDYIYKLILFGKKGEKTIHTIVGSLLVNRQGNGETYFRFQPLDMDGKGNCFHHFSTAIIAAASTKDEKESLHPVLKGITFSEEEPFQAELFQVDERKERIEEMEEVQEQINEQERERDDEMELEQEQAAEADPRADTDTLDNAVAADEDAAAVRKNYNSFYNEFILNACAHTCRVAEFYENVNPFEKDKTGAKWKKIINITNLPLVSPGAHYFATQYHHYLFGAKADEKGTASRFYFGIPGRFLDEEQPDGGRSGFTYWQPIRGANILDTENGRTDYQSRKISYGYWILAVDGKTGNIEEI